MQVVWSVEPDSAVLQLVFFLLFTANQRVLGSGVCVGKSTHKNTNLTLQQSAPSPLPGHCSHKVHPADTQIRETGPCCPGWWLGGGALFVMAPAGICLRCLGRARGNSLGCRHQVTRRMMASCGGVPGERSEDTAVLSVDTRRGKRRRSCHTYKHTHRSSFTSCTRTLSESQIQTPYQLPCIRRHLALQDWVANYVRKEWMVTVWWDYEIRSLWCIYVAWPYALAVQGKAK